MAFKALGGSTRRYLNTLTGETISRRQYQNLMQGISFEKKAAENKAADLGKALARPARGRTKATSQQEIEDRLAAAAEKAEQDNLKKLRKSATAAAKRVRPKVIRPQLLKTGHMAARVNFTTYDEYESYLAQMNTVKAPNGKRLITSYGVGIVGYDERTGDTIGATLVVLQSPRTKVSEEELIELTDDYIMEKPYFIFSHYYLHLAFDKEYAQGRRDKARRKNIPKQYRI